MEYLIFAEGGELPPPLPPSANEASTSTKNGCKLFNKAYPPILPRLLPRPVTRAPVIRLNVRSRHAVQHPLKEVLTNTLELFQTARGADTMSLLSAF